MGKKKLTIIDDSQPTEPVVEEQKVAKRKQGQDTLVEQLKAELGIEEEAPKVSGASEETPEEQNAPEVSQAKEVSAEPEAEEKKKVQPKVGKTKPRSKKYQEAAKLIDPEKKYTIDEAVDLAKEVSYTKFDGTLEIHLNSVLKNLRGSVALPFASGKKVRILAFGKGAEESGADQVGDDKKLEQIKEGKIDFDVLLTTPEWMPKMAALAKVLGPKGLMPNPKNGSITEDLKGAVTDAQSGKVEYKTEANGKVIHISLGKVSQPKEELTQNVKVLLSSIGKSKVRKVTLSPTMGPGVKLDLSSL
jgi:large subunit ribosomal protein L1